MKLSIADPQNASEENAGFKILGSVSYDSADVGQRRAKIYAISPESSDYTCDYEQTFDAKIVKALADNLEVIFTADKSVYGDSLKVEQTIKSNIKDEKAKTLEAFGAQFTYSLDGTTYMSLDELVPKLHVGSNEIRYKL